MAACVTDFVKVCETVRRGPDLCEAKPLERRRRRSRSRSRSRGPRALPESESSKYLAIEGSEKDKRVALPPEYTPSLGLCTVSQWKIPLELLENNVFLCLYQINKIFNINVYP